VTCHADYAQYADFGLWVIGIISAAALLLSAVLAFIEFFLSITNSCGRHTAGLAFPMGCEYFSGCALCTVWAALMHVSGVILD
jgi:hypothetical protein